MGSVWACSHARFAIHLILCCKEGSFATLWATVCSSWVQINSGTSFRSILNPSGDLSRKYINDANTMTSRKLDSSNAFLCHGKSTMRSLLMKCPRMCLLLLLVVARGGSWLLEQPRSSVMGEYHRFKQVCDTFRVP